MPDPTARADVWTNAPPDTRTADEVIAEMRAAMDAIAALPAVVVRLLMPSTVLAALHVSLPHALDDAINGIAIEVDNDLPRATVRVVYSDGTEEAVRL